jgi:aminodeoxyfutalosine deaminase
MFDTTLNAEYAVAADLLDLDAAGVADLAVAAVDASFMSPHDKARLRAEIADHLADHQ